jgi:hypothetical protein
MKPTMKSPEELVKAMRRLDDACNDVKANIILVMEKYGVDTGVDSLALVLGDICGHLKNPDRALNMAIKALELATHNARERTRRHEAKKDN